MLYGLAQGYDLQRCGMLGSIAAEEVIGHVGLRPEVSLRELAGARITTPDRRTTIGPRLQAIRGVQRTVSKILKISLRARNKLLQIDFTMGSVPLGRIAIRHTVRDRNSSRFAENGAGSSDQSATPITGLPIRTSGGSFRREKAFLNISSFKLATRLSCDV